MNQYDYIIAGAGASGLSLLMHMIRSNQFADKKILLVDKSPKTKNDRTWCFWEIEKGFFDEIVCKRWNKMWFYGVNGKSQLHNISPYQYKMIRGIDFYKYCFDVIRGKRNIAVKYGNVDNLQTNDKGATISIDGSTFSARYIFSSLLSAEAETSKTYFIWQHFKGWIIKTNANTFTADEATLMDFRVDQQCDCRFVYVMPLNESSALVEYTVFSEEKLKDEQYDAALATYCENQLGIARHQYTIEEEEFGMIPMTNATFPASDGNVIFIGTAGGQTKASTGFTFRFIQRHSSAIVDALIGNAFPAVNKHKKKFDFYDSVLLKIITERQLAGANIFTDLFYKNEMKHVMKFLDNDTSLVEDLKIMRSLPTGIFMRAALAHVVK